MNTVTERELLQKMDCPFIIKLHYAFQSNDKLYMVMDFANGGFFGMKKLKILQLHR